MLMLCSLMAPPRQRSRICRCCGVQNCTVAQCLAPSTADSRWDALGTRNSAATEARHRQRAEGRSRVHAHTQDRVAGELYLRACGNSKS
eukprot:1714624-Pyramimonas_sp.AAC.1